MFKIDDLRKIMYNAISISMLNDFIFCPASIYFHNLYGSMEHTLYQSQYQLNGTYAHKTIDNENYTTSKNVIMNMEVYCEYYNLYGKIDTYYVEKQLLVERKKHISSIFDGQVFQLYGQYFGMKEMGFYIKQMQIYSMDDNKKYNILLPEEDLKMLKKFESVINDMKTMSLKNFVQKNQTKCINCIYEPACDRSLKR